MGLELAWWSDSCQFQYGLHGGTCTANDFSGRQGRKSQDHNGRAVTAGPIDYVDTSGDGPTIVSLHGVLMNDTVWRGVIAELASHSAASHRHCRWVLIDTRCEPELISASTASPCSWPSFSSDSIYTT